jgi:ABC-2 type transport system permease protein
MAILFASLAGGISIIWDRQFGTLKDILTAPVSRFFVVCGKATGDVTIATIQGILIMAIGMIAGANYISLIGVLKAIIVMFFLGMGFDGLGVMLASKIDNHEAFQMVMSFLVMPLIMLSGAFYPLSGLPYWLKIIVYANPFTYGVEAVRWNLYGTSAIPILLSITVIILFPIVTIGLAGKMFGKMSV